MDTVRLFLLAVCCLGRALAVTSPVLPLSFEQRDPAFFVARYADGGVSFRPARVTVGGVTLHFVMALGATRLEGVGPASPATYLGAVERRTFSQFPKLAMRGLYPGVEAVFYGNAGRLEYDLELAPGVSPTRLCLQFENARRLRLEADGSLIAEGPSGPLRQLPPRVFQGRTQVRARYVLLGANRFAIRLGKYDRRLPLTIDPVLVYAKYFGGSGSDIATAVATDTQGNVYVAGTSNSLDFPNAEGFSSKPLPPLIALTNSGQTVTPLPIAAENSVTAIGGTPDGNILYVAASGGIYRSANGGATWKATAPLPNLIFSQFQANLTVSDITVDKFDPARVYVATNRGLLSTASEGQSWSQRDYDLAATDDGSIQAASVTVSQVDHTILYATTGRPNYLYKSIDAAGTWQILNPAYPGEPPAGYYPTSKIVFTLVGSDLYVVDALSIFLKSTDGGVTWQRGSAGLFDARGIRVDPNNPSTIFVLDTMGVQKSVDGGQTFASVNPPGVQGSAVSAFTYDSSSGTLYMATGASVYASSDQGVNWQAAPVSPANLHTLQAIGGRVFAGLDTPQTTFLVKFDPSGTRLLYSTFFTGKPVDYPVALSVDAQGSVYLAGNTQSQNLSGVTKVAPLSPPPYVNGYVAKVTPDGSNLAWLAAFGGSKGVSVSGLTIDSNGAAYLAGLTQSRDFPTTAGAFQPAIPSAPCTRPSDPFFFFHTPDMQAWGFVSKLSPDGGSLAYSTLLTGTCGSALRGIAVNTLGEAVVTGYTTSGDMPVTPNAYQGAFPGPLDKTGYPLAFTAGFVARLSAAGDRVLGGTYVGGGFTSQVNAVALDSSGNPVLTGSTWGIAPGATPGAYQTAVTYKCAEPIGIFGPPSPPSNGADAFVLKLDPALSKVGYLTYLGGACFDGGNYIALDPTGNVWVSGATNSGDFPLNAPFEEGAASSGFVSELSPDGSKLLFSSSTDGTAMAMDTKGFVYLAGVTYLSTIPKRSGPNSFTPSAFLGKIDPTAANPTVVVNSIVNVSNSNNTNVQPFTSVGVAPGKLVQIVGHNLGPATKVDAQVDSTGRLPFTLAGTRVLFDSFPAPLISVQESAIVCFVPFEVSLAAQVKVDVNGQASNSMRVGIPASVPEILMIANQDGTANSAANPAPQGSVVVVYVTGLGQTNPASVDGQVTTSTTIVPLVQVNAYINNIASPPQFVAAAKGMVAGITQVNVLIPAGKYTSNPNNLSVNFANAPVYIAQ